MKVIADTIKNADAVFAELNAFSNTILELYRDTMEYSRTDRKDPLPRFVSNTTLGMKSHLVYNFSAQFPNIASLIINGQGGGSGEVARLYTGCFNFNEGQKAVQSKKCIFLSDADRTPVNTAFGTAAANIIVFLCSQFKLYDYDNEVYMSVHKYCEQQGVTPGVLYDLLQGSLLEVGGTWCAYDTMSPLNAAMEDLDPIFLEECRDAGFPLTDELASKILDGELTVAIVRGNLDAYKSGEEEIEGEGTLSSFVDSMSLE